jgi:hypothetical protein
MKRSLVDDSRPMRVSRAAGLETRFGATTEKEPSTSGLPTIHQEVSGVVRVSDPVLVLVILP